MSAEAIAKLRKLWEKLSFARVSRTIAREPEDVLSIDIPNIETTDEGLMIRNHDLMSIDSNRTKDIPEEYRWCARVAWRFYYGFTDHGVYFNMDGYNELDTNVDSTLNFSNWANHMGGYEKPPVGTLIAGEVVDGPKGKRFDKWFVCPPELQLLITIVRKGTTLTEEELAEKLLTSGFPDTLWAIARLFLFDNVKAFLDNFAEERPRHPHLGKEYTSKGYFGDKKPKVNWSGMYLPEEEGQFVHKLSYDFEPRWWEEFKRLVNERGWSQWEHPRFGGFCSACATEEADKRDQRNNPNWLHLPLSY